MTEFRILGPLEVLEDGRQVDLGGAKQRALLAILLLHSNEVVSSDRLIDALWEETPPETAQKALQVYVSQLRKILGRERLETKAPGYRLRVDENEFDLARFQHLAEERPREALALWRGPPLQEFAYQRFAQAEIARLEDLRLACLEQRIEEDLAHARHSAVVSELERLVSQHPLRERLRAQLMLALYRSGRQAEALEVYQEARRALTEELGIEPSQELRELQQAILRQDRSLAPERPAVDATLDEASTAPPVGEPVAPREVRKTVTIVFADLAGSTELGEQLDPETLRRVLGRYFQEMRKILERHGGTVEKFIGDAVMAVFGIPLVHEDDALRALRAAVEMRERLAQLNAEFEQQWGVRLLMRIGVNTGEVIAGGSEAPTYATGDAVNVAARLQQRASPSEILVAHRTYRLVRDLVLAEPLAPLEVKGKSATVETVRLLDVLPSGPERRRFESPMVGRERERRRLHDAFERAVADRSCQLFTILGAAGVGKSRLVREFFDDLADTARTARGRCLPYGEGITYWPVVEAVRDAAGLGEADSVEAMLEKLAGVLEGEDDADLVISRLAEVIGLQEESSGAEETFRAVRTFFEALSRWRPLVLVFDDIHWGEATFLDLLDHLADWTHDAPLLLICVARPELLEVRPNWGGGKLNSVNALLEPLSDAESWELVGNLIGAELEEAARRRIVDAAGGNPLFVEEMLNLLVEGGGRETTSEMPPTIQALLAARLDRLADGERSAIEAASVEGQVFHERSVEELTGHPAADVHASLQALVRKDLIRTTRPVFAGDVAYRFRHILIRDAAYESIAKSSRATLHERHADWLEAVAGERALEFEEILGYHLEQAFRYRADLGPLDDESRQLARRAASRLGAAGRRAFMRIDAPAGVNLISRALALLPANDPQRIDLVPSVRALQGIGDVSWAEPILEEAMASGDPRIRAHARVQQGFLRLFFTATDITPEELIPIAEEAIAVFEPLNDNLGLARAWRLVAQAEYLGRRGGASTSAALRGLDFARRADDRFEHVEMIDWLGVTLVLGPTPAPEGIRVCERLLHEVAGDAVLELTVLGPLACLVGIQGRAEEAEALITRGRQMHSNLRDPVWLFSVMLGFYFSWATDPAAAERDLRPVYDGLKKIGEKSHLCSIATVLAQAVYAQGRYEEADELALEAQQTARANDVHSHIVWRGIRAKVLARRGNFDAAQALGRDAVAYAEVSDFLHSHADALVDLAEVLTLAGKAREAVPLIERAIRLDDEKGNVVAVELARAKLASLQATV